MITKEQILKAAADNADQYAFNADELHTTIMQVGFRDGVRWAIEQMQAENARLSLEKAAIAGERDAAVLENARLRAALSSVVTDILDAARIVNDGKVPAYWKSTLEAAQAALNNTEK